MFFPPGYTADFSSFFEFQRYVQSWEEISFDISLRCDTRHLLPIEIKCYKFREIS